MNDDTSITVSRTIDASAAEIFDVLSLPERHVELDGSGFVRSVDHGDRITSTGQVFTMNMTGDHMGGDYQTDNHVTGYDKDHLLAWETAPAGTQPPGWQWVWELVPQGPGNTEVRHSYDWGKVTDQELLQKVSFPLVTEEQLEGTLARLAAAVSGG
ncbi:SRPBCC family protein [Ornithinimicrobium pratense]|uniref:Polyketide cyclase n=1 Tax=Ornithinimicrobium pratense TaxID=2593973 RepID=A0A5J6V3E2_9MICO|nr:SRPBCC family protein [Ornithinimicrobium pratense]QFG67681.1 polyketide cyclase [Ornithinimicrobium pratense]